MSRRAEGRTMGDRNMTRYALNSCVTPASLVGCSGLQPPIGAPGAVPQSRAITTHADRGKSWMLPEAKREALIYATGGCSGTCVLSYPGGILVGALSGYSGNADCSDRSGNVFISENTQVVEFAHGGTTPIAAFILPYSPAVGCSIDSETGNLAVVNSAFVSVLRQVR